MNDTATATLPRDATDLEEAKLLLQRALQLSHGSREYLVECLEDSLDAPQSAEVNATDWKTEIARRIAAIDSGAVTLIPAADVFAVMQAKYG